MGLLLLQKRSKHWYFLHPKRWPTSFSETQSSPAILHPRSVVIVKVSLFRTSEPPNLLSALIPEIRTNWARSSALAAIGPERSTIAAMARNEVFKALSLTSTWIAMTTRSNHYPCQTSSMAVLRRVLSSHQPSQSRKPSQGLRCKSASTSYRHTGTTKSSVVVSMFRARVQT